MPSDDVVRGSWLPTGRAAAAAVDPGSPGAPPSPEPATSPEPQMGTQEGAAEVGVPPAAATSPEVGPAPVTKPAGEDVPAEPALGSGRALVIIPTYNERENIPKLVPLVLAQDPRIDVLIVDDNSPDGTGAVADELAASEPRVHVLHRAGKLGLGTAYIAGFHWGIERFYDLLQEMDADFSHDPSHLPQFLAAAQQFDVVLGSRYLDGRVTVVNWPIKRLLLSYYANVYARVVTGLPVWDATGGFKCFRRKVLEAIPLERIESEGYAFQIEMNFRAWRRGFQLGEIPIVFVDRSLGESKMSKRIIREAVTKVWKLRWLQLRDKA